MFFDLNLNLKFYFEIVSLCPNFLVEIPYVGGSVKTTWHSIMRSGIYLYRVFPSVQLEPTFYNSILNFVRTNCQVRGLNFN